MMTPHDASFSRRSFLKSAMMAGGATLLCNPLFAADSDAPPLPKLKGNRFLTFNTVVRVNQIEVSRDHNAGEDEGTIHTLESVRKLRDCFERGFPGGRMTWAFSWLALQDPRPNYQAIRKEVVEYHHRYGDEITFIPGLTEREGVHVAQANIWSQYAIDNGDGDGSLSYPYYPSRQHFCKPAQTQSDLIDCVNLDGWTMDFLAARRRGFDGGYNSRMGVGPIETVFAHGAEKGLRQMVETTAVHFDSGFTLNGFAWVTNCWEISLLPRSIDSLTAWLQEIRRRWPATLCVTQGEFGLAWRQQSPTNDQVDYRFVERGTGIGGSDADKEIRWFMNRDFRLALLRDWKANGPERVIDFTRYDLPAQEPPDATPDKPARNWSIMNRINQKGTRPQDKPVLLAELPAEDRELIRRRHPELLKS
ncbi:MAG: DUF3863 domain-containing protein [Verrucomicrobia bacterium]|nr:DUF3863 domain-containing protein [Verrucomicrobiota bacterium]